MPMNIAHTKYGSLSGVKESESCTAFRGIPYAAPPTGDLRWKRPQPPIPWTGVRKAWEYGPCCPQIRALPGSFYHKEFYQKDDSVVQSEDCLYLNVWTPAESPDEGLPVLFWIHGGAFDHGSGSELEFDGARFSELGVILVTINYRCHALGFLCHPWLDAETEDGCSGNYGLYDQIAALDWVRENIRAFGGDPRNITIFGQSAGAMSVQDLVVSPLAAGKFEKVIMQSGGGIDGLRLDGDRQTAAASAEKLIRKLGVSSLEELRKVDPWTLAKTCRELQPEAGFYPIVDGRLLPDTPAALARAGRVPDVPYLLGSCQDEMGGETARLFAAGNRGWCSNQHALGRRAPYLYWFNRQMPGDDAGAFHSAELWYVFGMLSRCWRSLTEADHELGRVISCYWANFAACGDPNGDGLPLWLPCTAESATELTLGLEFVNRPVDLGE